MEVSKPLLLFVVLVVVVLTAGLVWISPGIDTKLTSIPAVPTLLPLVDDDDYSPNEDGDEYGGLTAGNETNKFALQDLVKFLDKTGQYPVIVGGIGDSGTRGVRQVLRELGVQMLNEGEVNHHGDSKIYEEHYSVYDNASQLWATRRARLLYKMAVHRTRQLAYNTPRTMFLLPFIVSALEHRVKFVHVLRDPKHIVSGNNQKMFMEECHRFYGGGPERKCPKTLIKRFQFWADTNWEIYQFAQRYMTNQSYLLVRTEDFVLGTPQCYSRLARFVGAKPSKLAMENAIGSATPYRHRYFGTEMNDRTKLEVFEALKRSSSKLDIYNHYDVKTVAQNFGYSTNSFELDVDCERL
ncbi:hypothetical protein BASA82_000094 [Batrachochytrium salamandrivorans]|nr:hypothetical protein BASA82_000094 [Batrachochytrium salamandrivorans]